MAAESKQRSSQAWHPHFWVLLTLSVTAALPLYAYRREYRVTAEGVRKTGSVVCFYDGDNAADPFALFFAYRRVACLPADEVLDLPPGLFHVFARHPEGYASAHRDYFVYRGAPAPEAGYEALEIPLERAGIADFAALVPTLKPGQSLGVWLSPGPGRRGTFFPLVDGEKTILVPAGNPFVPLLIQNRRPVAVGETMVVEPDQLKTVRRFTSREGHSDVVAWVRLDSAVANEVDGPLDIPDVVVVSQEQTIDPLFDLESPEGATHTLLFFKDVPAGAAEIRVRGKKWSHTRRPITASTRPVTVVDEYVLLTPAAAVTVSWDRAVAGDAAADCGVPADRRPVMTAVLSRCDGDAGDPQRPCKAVARRAAPLAAAASLTFEGVPSGQYTVTMTPPFGESRTLSTALEAGQEATLSIPIESFEFFGTVRIDDRPVKARLVFESGETTSNAEGAYTASLSADPLTNLVNIYDCTTAKSYTYVPKGRIAPNAPFDIELRQTKLRVTVKDQQTATPIPEAAVYFAPVKKVSSGQTEVLYTSPPQNTDSTGQVTFESIPADRSILLCAQHNEYSSVCTAPLSTKQVETGEATVDLKRQALRGRVIGHAGTGATLAWVDRGGHVTEQVTPAGDGTFAFNIPHSVLEHLIYVSDRRPLTVLPMPPVWQPADELLVTLPDAPSRSFTVHVPSMATPSGFVGIWVGNMYVPLQILAYHQELRRMDARIYRGQRLVIRDIAETFPISVAFGAEDPKTRTFVDVFTLPEYAGIDRVRVSGGSVTIPR